MSSHGLGCLVWVFLDSRQLQLAGRSRSLLVTPLRASGLDLIWSHGGRKRRTHAHRERSLWLPCKGEAES